jgi:hypothetical protein
MLRYTLSLVCILSCFVGSVLGDEKASPKMEWISLSQDFSEFRQPVDAWKIVGDAHLNKKDAKRLDSEPGKIAFFNGNNQQKASNLVTKRKRGDIEVFLEFMIPKDSNFGVKLLGDYEIRSMTARNRTN